MGKFRMHGYEDWGLSNFATNGNEQLFALNILNMT